MSCMRPARLLGSTGHGVHPTAALGRHAARARSARASRKHSYFEPGIVTSSSNWSGRTLATTLRLLNLVPADKSILPFAHDAAVVRIVSGVFSAWWNTSNHREIQRRWRMASSDVLSAAPSVGSVRPHLHACGVAGAGTRGCTACHSKLSERCRLEAVLSAIGGTLLRPMSTRVARAHAA